MFQVTTGTILTLFALGGFLVDSACGGPNREPTLTVARSSPTPISPVDARIAATLSFPDTATNLGDPEHDLHVEVTTNIPVPIQVDATVDFNTNCGITRECWSQAAANGQQVGGEVVKIDPGHWGNVTLRTLDGSRWPQGRYQIYLFAQSYWTILEPQDPAYTKWVGGGTGPRLAGNAQAIADPDHPAVLNLAAVVTMTGP